MKKEEKSKGSSKPYELPESMMPQSGSSLEYNKKQNMLEAKNKKAIKGSSYKESRYS